MTVQIQFRRGMASEWTAANPLLAQGEMGLEWDTGKFKVGTGSTYWNSLVYSSGQTGPQGPVGPSGSSNSITIANQGSVLTSSTVYINFTGAVYYSFQHTPNLYKQYLRLNHQIF